MRGRSVLAGTCAVALMGCWPGIALATGGGDISSAPNVAYGQQEFGNTATDSPQPGSNNCVSWWLLPAITGDKLTVDWTAEATTGAGEDTAETAQLFPPGTTDFNRSENPAVQQVDVPDNATREELQYTTNRDGTLPLEFIGPPVCPVDAGPYYFTAYITHELILDLRAQPKRGRHTTTFSVAVHNPDGAVISPSTLKATFQLRSSSHWQTIKTTGSPLRLTRKWTLKQRMKFQSIRVSVSGPSYRTASTSIRTKAV